MPSRRAARAQRGSSSRWSSASRRTFAVRPPGDGGRQRPPEQPVDALELGRRVGAQVLEADERVAVAEQARAVGGGGLEGRLPDEQGPEEVGQRRPGSPSSGAAGDQLLGDPAARPQRPAGAGGEEASRRRGRRRSAAAGRASSRRRRRAGRGRGGRPPACGSSSWTAPSLWWSRVSLIATAGARLEQVAEQLGAVLGQLRVELGLRRPRAAPVELLDRQAGIALGAEPLAELARLGEHVLVAGPAAAADRLGCPRAAARRSGAARRPRRARRRGSSCPSAAVRRRTGSHGQVSSRPVIRS